MRLRWSDRALLRFETYLDYLEACDPATMQRARMQCREAVGRLRVAPLSGRPSRWPGFRELSLPRWRKLVVYEVTLDQIIVIAFYDTRQNLDAIASPLDDFE